MSEVKIIRVWKWSAIALAVLNIGILTFILTQAHPPGRNEPNNRLNNFIIHELQLNDTQEKTFETLRRAHHKTIDSLQEAGKELRHHFFDNLKSDAPDSVSINRFAIDIANNQKQIELATFSHFRKLRKILTSQQQEKFDHIIEDVLHRMAGPQGPPPPPPHDRQ